MLTKEQVLKDAMSRSEKSGMTMLDARDLSRLADFFPVEDWKSLGFTLKDGATPPEVRPWTEEAIKAQTADDLEFAFEKALNRRGISASLMYNVVKTWLWVLEDELQHNDDYAQYGLPLLKAVAVKYGLPNPIGDDDGDESQYESD